MGKMKNMMIDYMNREPLEVGERYSAIGTCGMAKDKEVKGILQKEKVGGEYVLLSDDRGIPCTVNKYSLKKL